MAAINGPEGPQHEEPSLKINAIPHGNHIVIQPEANPQETPSGIIVPEASVQRGAPLNIYGRVLAVGPGKIAVKDGHVINIPPDPQVGDRVVAVMYRANHIMIDGQAVIVIDADQVLCTIPDKKEATSVEE